MKTFSRMPMLAFCFAISYRRFLEARLPKGTRNRLVVAVMTKAARAAQATGSDS